MQGDFQTESHGGRNCHFGIREHAIGATLNGLSLVKVRPFGAGLFIFVDYMRGSMLARGLFRG
jgi:transketolase